MIAICKTCQARIITTGSARWIDPKISHSHVAAFGKAHRCGDGFHEPNPETLPVNTQAAIAGRKTRIVNVDLKEVF